MNNFKKPKVEYLLQKVIFYYTLCFAIKKNRLKDNNLIKNLNCALKEKSYRVLRRLVLPIIFFLILRKGVKLA